jgi:hypothetical protein
MARVRRAGILLVVLVVALGLGGAAAGAKKKHKKVRGWPSKITLTHPATNQFAGKVSSKLKGCRGSRVVTLTYIDPQNGLTSPLSVQRTDGKGRYEVVLPKDAFFGTYQAQVAQRKIRALKAKQRCKAAHSSTIVLQ